MSMIAQLIRVNKITLESFLNDSSLLEEIILGGSLQGVNYLDIDKSWDGILFLLNGKGSSDINHPLTKILFPEQIIDDALDFGYGPPQYLTSEQVQELNNTIALIKAEDLRAKYDSVHMTKSQIYPSIWDNAEQTITFLIDSFKDLQLFYAQASKEGEAIITFLT